MTSCCNRIGLTDMLGLAPPLTHSARLLIGLGLGIPLIEGLMPGTLPLLEPPRRSPQ